MPDGPAPYNGMCYGWLADAEILVRLRSPTAQPVDRHHGGAFAVLRVMAHRPAIDPETISTGAASALQELTVRIAHGERHAGIGGAQHGSCLPRTGAHGRLLQHEH